jgi:L-threonylcarbamoyladenylate synthase
VLLIKDIADSRLVSTLRSGGIAVIRTDTLYGIVACADNQQAVNKVYAAKGRDPRKSCVILLDQPESSYGHADELTHDIDAYHEMPTSFLIEADDAPSYLLRENTLLAYRVPASAELKSLLQLTGPLIAPSANPEGAEPAHTVDQAMEYFGDAVDIYVDGGEVPHDTPPSRIVRVHPDGSLEQLR